MSLRFTTAQTDNDLRQILALQATNLKSNISEEVKKSQGFVTVCHSWDEIVLLYRSTPQIVAKDGDQVVGYALAMLPSLGKYIPDLKPMFELFAHIPWRGCMLSDSNYYVMGQVCVAEDWRGQGVFEGLYRQHFAIYSPSYDLLVTEVSKSNTRSQRAHERVGFLTILEHQDHVDTWNVVAWEF
jgi:ribosomal protein S18 acetylase RimI-like enzyme